MLNVRYGLTSRFTLYALLLALVGVTLSACASIEIRPPSAAAVQPVATLVPRDHALALLGVDYDPPAQGSELSLGALDGGITLMVAVANQGLQAEHDVEVSAALVDPAVGTQAEHLVDETQILPELPAGEVRLVRFPRVTNLPPRERYQLQLAVKPVPGEWDTGDNYQTYDILIHSQP